MSARSAVHAFVDDATHDAWHDTAADHGASVTALVEAIGRRIEDLLDAHPDIVRDAHRVDAARRARNGR